jgi:hypothetical protein
MEDNDLDFSQDLAKFFKTIDSKKTLLIISLVGITVFSNALFNNFAWDDFVYIINNPQVHQFNLATIFGQNSWSSVGNYRPIAPLYFSLLYSVFVENPFFYHLFSIIFHILNSFFVFLLFKNFFKPKLSLILSLTFLVHPMQVESATFIAIIGVTFFFTFGMPALLLSMNKKIGWNRLVAIGGLLLLSLLDKEAGILFLVMIIFYQLLYTKKRIAIFSIVGLLPLLVYFFIRFFIVKIPLAAQAGIVPIANLSLAERLISIPAIIFYYIKTFFLPVNLMISQYWVVTKISDPNFYLPLLVDIVFLGLLGVFGVYFYKKNTEFKKYLFFCVWFVVGLLLHIQIFPLDGTVADRWFYFPMVGIIGVIGVIWEWVTSQFKAVKYTPILIGLVLIVFSVRTIIRNGDWADNLTLYSRDAKLGGNFNVEMNLANEYNKLGTSTGETNYYQMALPHYQKSVDLFPYATNLFNMAVDLDLMKQKDQSRIYYDKILEVRDYSPSSYSRVLSFSGWMLLQQDTPQNAKNFILKALKKDPENGYLWAHLAIAEYRLGNKQAALDDAKKAKSFSPTEPILKLNNLIERNEDIPGDINITAQGA